MKQVKFHAPGQGDRSFIVGQTGQGKTQLGMYLLSLQDFAETTWIAFDFKGRDILEDMPCSEIIDLADGVPQKPGLFYARVPTTPADYTSEFFLACEKRGNVGIFVDEALPLKHTNAGFRTCLYAGRSANVSMIYCSQKPFGIETMARDQATFFFILDVIAKEDRRELQSYIRRENMDIEPELPRFHYYWYDVRERGGDIRPPSPDLEASFRRILDKLPEPEVYLDPETLDPIDPSEPERIRI